MATTTDRPRTSDTHVRAPALPDLVAAPVGALFGTLSRLRGTRIFHPEGEIFDGELKIFPGEDHPDVPLFREAGPHPAAIRLSRAVGLPEPLPDILGLSVKLVGIYGPGRDQDFLMASSSSLPVARRFLIPGTSFLGQTFTTVLPYRVNGEIVLFGAWPAAPVRVDGDAALEEAEEAADEGVLQFAFGVASRLRGWRRVGVLYVREPVEGAELVFNPWTTGGDIRPAGPLNLLRDVAYRASQRARPDTPPAQEPDPAGQSDRG